MDHDDIPAAYFDHAATTPMYEEAVAAMLPFLTGNSANPSGVHAGARQARRAIDDAREDVAALVGCEPGEVVFTSGGTEADNLALSAGAGRTVLVSAIEHHAVLVPAAVRDARVVPVDAEGTVEVAALAAMLDASVGLVSVMSVNNEVGTVQPLAAIHDLVRELAPAATLHTDAVQAAAWIALDALCGDFDLVSLSAHKFGGPTGVGVLVVRNEARQSLRPLVRGGPQERELRAGTENVAGIVATGAAARVLRQEREATAVRVAALRDRLEDGLLAAIPGAVVSSPRARRIAGSCPLQIAGVESEELLVVLDEMGIAASAGAACASGALEPSHVLLAMGATPPEAKTALRLSLGWSSSDDDVDRALAVVPAAVGLLRCRRGAP